VIAKKHILICAYAANPSMGSESYVGWAGILSISRKHRVTAIVHGHNRKDIEKALPSLPQKENLTFHFLGETHRWHPNRMIARFQDWKWLAAWNKQAQVLACDLVAKGSFDVAHHVTIATWRMPSPLGDLGIPLVWGPVGGGEYFPFSFHPILSPVAKAFEFLRWLGNQVTLRSAGMRHFTKSVSVALGNNPETLEAFARIGIPRDLMHYLSQSFLPEQKFLSRATVDSKVQRTHSPISHLPSSRPHPRPPISLNIFAGGNMEGRKGVAIALMALSKLGRKGIAFEFTFGGLGPELRHLQNLAARIDFGVGKVTLGHHFSGEEYRSQLAGAHVYLLPSLREGAPVTMIEAMACGAVPIVANAGGAPMVVDESCGFVVEITTPGEMASRICEHLESLSRDPELLNRLAIAAWNRARERCMEDTYLAGIEAAYEKATAKIGGGGFG